MAGPLVLACPETQDTVHQLQASGYKVILNKVGGAPLDECTFSSVRPGRQITQPVTAGGANLTDKVLRF